MIQTYLQPERLDEALEHVARGALPVAGATALYASKRKDKLGGELVDITRLGLGEIAIEPGRVVLGATARLADVLKARIPGVEGALLRQVCRAAAPVPLRNAITLGGNLAHVAYWADTPIAMLALDASVEIQRAGQPARTVPIADCLASGTPPWEGGLITRFILPLLHTGSTGPSTGSGRTGTAYPVHPERSEAESKGQSAKHVDPVPPEGSWGFGHERFARTANDYAFATACAVLERHGDVARKVRVVLGALQPRPFRVREAEALVEGQALTPELLARVSRAVRDAVSVASNFRASPDYRRALAGTLAARALQTAFSSAKREH